jgi:hypothetical protein
MNFRMVALLSLFGLAMGAAAVAGVIPRGMELPLWGVACVVGAILIGRSSGKRFLTGLVAGTAAELIAYIVILLLFDLYLANNPAAVEAFANLPAGTSPRMVVGVLAPIVSICYGLVTGLLAWLGGRFLTRRAPAAG